MAYSGSRGAGLAGAQQLQRFHLLRCQQHKGRPEVAAEGARERLVLPRDNVEEQVPAPGLALGWPVNSI